MQTATVEDVQARLPELIEALAPGGQLMILRDGTPIALLSRLPTERPRTILGAGKGRLIHYEEDDEHLKDFEDYMK